MKAYFNTPELTAIRKAVEDLDKQEDDLEDKLKQRELAIATQLAGGAQPTPAAPTAPATPATPPTPAAPQAPATPPTTGTPAANDLMAAVFLAAYHEAYDNRDYTVPDFNFAHINADLKGFLQ